MPRFSTIIHDKDGRPVGIACGHRRHRSCSTPGCRNDAPLSCDAPVTRENPPKPKRGDTRLHRERKIVFEVLAIDEQREEVTVTQHGRRTLQVVSIADWFRKSDATCDRPLCPGCATRVGEIDLCGPHAREATKET